MEPALNDVNLLYKDHLITNTNYYNCVNNENLYLFYA